MLMERATKNMKRPTTQITPKRNNGNWTKSAKEEVELFAFHLENTFMPLERESANKNNTLITKQDKK